MGGRAFEALAAEGDFAAALDFAPQEPGNHLHGSAISAGPDRLTAAGHEREIKKDRFDPDWSVDDGHIDRLRIVPSCPHDDEIPF